MRSTTVTFIPNCVHDVSRCTGCLVKKAIFYWKNVTAQENIGWDRIAPTRLQDGRLFTREDRLKMKIWACAMRRPHNKSL